MFFFFRSGPREEAAPAEAPFVVESQLSTDPSALSTENDLSIAVLPLTNMSPDPGNAFFADGVQEDRASLIESIEVQGSLKGQVV